jgi:hypothetical protein
VRSLPRWRTAPSSRSAWRGALGATHTRLLPPACQHAAVLTHPNFCIAPLPCRGPRISFTSHLPPPLPYANPETSTPQATCTNPFPPPPPPRGEAPPPPLHTLAHPTLANIKNPEPYNPGHVNPGPQMLQLQGRGAPPRGEAVRAGGCGKERGFHCVNAFVHYYVERGHARREEPPRDQLDLCCWPVFWRSFGGALLALCLGGDVAALPRRAQPLQRS